jgi:hypothetical protein
MTPKANPQPERHRQRGEDTSPDAAARTGSEPCSGGSRGSASTASVLIESSNCGFLVVDRGATFDNQQVVASAFEQGSEYEFDIGWYSRFVMKRLLNGLPTAADYRLSK